MKITFNDVVGATMGVIALLVVAYASVGQSNDGAMTALVGVLGAAVGYFLRGKVEQPKP